MLFLLSLASAVTLEEAWAASEKNGVDVALVREQYRAAKTLTGAAWSLISPKLVLRGSFTRNDEEMTFDSSGLIPEDFQQFVEPTDPLVVRKLQYFDGSLSVVQPLFSGRALPLLRAAYGEVHAAAEELRANEAMIRSGVASAYWGVLVSRESILIAERALESAKKHQALAETSVAVGLAPPTAKLQAQIAASRAERDVAAAVQARVAAEEAFSRLTGLAADTPVELPLARELSYDSAERAIERAKSARPSIRAAEERARSAQMQKLARGLDWLPEVNGRFTYVWTENTSAFNDNPEFWMVVAESEWVLWDGGYRLSEQAKAGAQARMTTLAQQRAVDEASGEIRSLWEQRERAKKALLAVQHEVVLAAENARLADAAWTAGSITFLELEDARLGEMASQLAELQERMNLDLASLSLLAATGDL